MATTASPPSSSRNGSPSKAAPVAPTPVTGDRSAAASPPSSAPAVTLIPATPESPLSKAVPSTPSSSPPTVAEPVMKEKAPTDSETNLVAKPRTSTDKGKSSSPISSLTRKLSGKSAPSAEVKTAESKEKAAMSASSTNPVTPSTTAPSASTPSHSTSTPAPSTSKPAQTPSQRSSQRKKRKRKGFAGLLLALGCLSAADFEEDEAAKTKREMLEKRAAAKAAEKKVENGNIKTAGTTAPVKEEGQGHQAETTATTGTTTLVEGGDREKAGGGEGGARAGDVVVAPVEPVTLSDDETAGVTSSAVQPPGSGSDLLTNTPRRPSVPRRESDSGPTTSNEKTETSGGYSNISDSDAQDETGNSGGHHDDEVYGLEEEYEDEEDKLIAQGGIGIPLDENGQPAPLLPPIDKQHIGRKCLVLDLDETLLHSSFKMLPSADYIVPVEIESQTHNVYVIKRPGVDHFLKEMGKIYEVVVFTASLSKYADPVLDMLDVHRVVRHRLFRESCYNHKGNYVKDLSQLGRDMETCIIIDNSPASYIFHPNNAVPVSTWFNDPHDTELTDLCPFLADLATVDDIRGVLDGSL